MADRLLDGVMVVDLTHIWAGPTCTQFLADFGAEVVKIEQPGGDGARRLRPVIDSASSYAFWGGNRNKRSMVLNLKNPAGLEVLCGLVARADVFVHNRRPRAIKGLGLAYADMRAINPSLIYAWISGYGPKSPLSEMGGQDLQQQAFGGIASVTGYDGDPRPSTPAGAAVVDWTAGALLAIGVLAALHGRRTTGHGQEVTTSLLAGALALQSEAFLRFLGDRQFRGKGKNGHPYEAPPYGIWKASDGKEFALSGGGRDEAWAEFCVLIGKPELARDSRFSTRDLRLRQREALSAILQEAFSTRTRDEWVRELRAAGLLATPAYDYEELCASSHLDDNDMLLRLPHPTAGLVTVLNSPVSISDADMGVRRPPPLPGQHTSEILAEFGYSHEAIDALYRCGAVG